MAVRNTFNFKRVSKKIRAGVGLYADTAAKQMEADAKRNRPWTDRTTNARNSTRGEFGWENDKAVIRLSGDVEYYPFLELAHEKKYAVLIPTIKKNVSQVMRGFQSVLKGLK